MSHSQTLSSSTRPPISDLDRFAPTSDPSNSNLVDDDDERYNTLSSSTESDESSGSLAHQPLTHRSSKRRRRLTSNPATTTAPAPSTTITPTATNTTPISSAIIISSCQIPPPRASSSSSSSSPTSNPSLPPIYHDHLSLNRSSYSDDSRSSSYTSRPSSPLDPPPHHLLPHQSSHPLYWSQSINPSSSYHHHHHLYHLKHHHHHHHHHHHPTSKPDHVKSISSFVNLSSGISSDHRPTGCLETVSSRFHGLLSPSSSNQHHPHQQPNDLQLSDDFVSNSESEFFHSHHLRTSAHPRRNNPRRYTPPHPSVTDPKRFPSLPLSPEPSPEQAHYRSKPSWFSSRRYKRKNSVHALSATSSSSTTSLHSSPSSLDQLLSQKSADSFIASSNFLPTSSRRSSTSRFRRWIRSFSSHLVLSIRLFNKSLGHRLPLGILLGLVLFISFAVSLTVFLVHYLDTDKEPLPWRTYCQEQREFPHQLADSLEPVNVFVGVFSIDSAYERRHLIRSTYARHSRPVDPLTGQFANNVQLKFVLGRPRIQHVRRVALEMETYNDIVILDIQENMNRGKTYAFMNWASENATIPVYYHPLQEPKPKTGINGIGGVMVPEGMETVNVGVGFKKADFVVKADDDAFIVLSELERHLRVAPRSMTYWGYLIRNLFMGGECYALSADLVSYVASSSEVLNYLTGAEDKKVAKWMRIHPNASQINWVTERCWIYDHPKAGTTYSHGFLFPDEVQRVREEGKFGLTDTEIAIRGVGRSQSYSTVSRWKERYIAPKSMMTMEEEVEALVEGGGRFASTDWRRPVGQLVPMDKFLFDSQDDRLLKSSIIGGPGSVKLSEPGPGQSTLPVRDHYQEPSLKFGRPPSELMAKMPAMEDLPESALKDKLREGLEAEMNDRKVREASKSRDPFNTSPDQSTGSITGTKPLPQFVLAPTLRYDPEEIEIRNQRFLNRPHGGTVVVHFLKRNEWFLETSLILLGRSKTWDDGLIPMVFEPTHKVRASKPEASSIQPTEDNSVVVSSDPIGERSQALSTVINPSSHGDRFYGPPQKKIKVGQVADWGKFNQVEEVKVGGLFGGARMFGSPVIEKDGTIREGRRIETLTDRPPASQRHESDFATPRTSTDQSRSSSSNQINHDTHLTVKDHERLMNSIADPRLESVDIVNDDGDDEIRKTQFGGAGWIRGKPRLRLADENEGPRFVSASKSDGEKGIELGTHTRDQGLKSFTEGSDIVDDSNDLSTIAQVPIVKLHHDPKTERQTDEVEAARGSNLKGQQRDREADDDDFDYEFENHAGTDSSLVLGKHQAEPLGLTPSQPHRVNQAGARDALSSSSPDDNDDDLATELLLASVA